MIKHTFSEIDEGVYLLRLPLPFRLNHVNCYLIEGKKGWTVIDAGLKDETTAKIWREVLTSFQVEKIVITHEHPDHYGYAATLQQLTGAPVYMSPQCFISARRFWSLNYLDSLKRFYNFCGLPEEMGKMLAEMADVVENVPRHPEAQYFLEEGQKINLGNEKYLVLHTPGHAEGLVCFYQPERKLLFSTDHILPHITPNISFWPGGDPNPLQTYLNSLEKMKNYPIKKALPSHGDPFVHVEERIADIIRHHEHRLNQLRAYVHTWTTVYEAYLCLFGQKPLTAHDMSFAVGETVAHLEYLVEKGELEKEENGEGPWLYRRL